MRLARFAVAGLAIGILAGFAAALLRPRPRLADESAIHSLTDATGGPIAWGSRPDRKARAVQPLPPLVPVVPRRSATPKDSGGGQ